MQAPRMLNVACTRAPTGMAGSSSVAGSTAVAGEGVPGLGTITAVLAGVGNTPAITHTHTEAALVAASRLWNQQSL